MPLGGREGGLSFSSSSWPARRLHHNQPALTCGWMLHTDCCMLYMGHHSATQLQGVVEEAGMVREDFPLGAAGGQVAH